jgi:excisionase family DNA binding protein
VNKSLISIGAATATVSPGVVVADYTRFLDDLRGVIRYELANAPAAPAGPPTAPVDELLSIREAAALLGVTVQTVHSWKQKGMLRYHKLGSRSYIKLADVQAALQGHQRTVKTGKGAARG